MNPQTTLKATFLLLVLPFALHAQDFEDVPTLSASAVLKPEFAAGPGFTVRDELPTYGGRNDYMIDSDAGVFEADGNAMLIRRIREINAIARLREISRGDEYKAALAAAAKSPLLMAKGLVEHPVGTVTGVPEGLWKFMNRAGQKLSEAVEGGERNAYTDSNAEQLIGFSKAKRDVALKLGVDPYTSNPVLQRELNGISWAAYAGKMTFTLATVPVGGAAGMALTAVGVSDTFEQAIRDQSPADLRLASRKRLLAMGCDGGIADVFLNNPALSPSVQTALVLHLDSLNGVANRQSFIELAAGQTGGEGDALFFSETARILSKLHNEGTPLARLAVLSGLPVALDRSDRLVVGLEWDYAAWTPNAARFVGQLKASKVGSNPPKGVVIAISGDASPMAQQKLKDAGVTLYPRLAPGPLK